MKKLFLALFSIVLALLLTACSTTQNYFGGSGWLANSSNTGVSSVLEECSYNVTHTAGEQSNFSYSFAQGSYKTKLSNTTYGENNTPCYLFETELSITATYNFGESDQTVNDNIKTKVYFLSVNDKLKALYSEREAVVSTPKLKDDKYLLSSFEYKITQTYSDNDCVVDFTPIKQENGEFTLEEGKTTYEKVFNKLYFDNELLLFAPRALKLSSASSISFNSIDALSKANRSMLMTADNESPITTVQTPNYTRNGVNSTLPQKKEEVACNTLNSRIDGTFAGSAVVLNYAKEEETDDFRRLISMTVTLTHDLGKLNYLITSATISH